MTKDDETGNANPRQGGNSEMILVPRLPTKAMLEAAWADAMAEDAAGVWKSMIETWILTQ